MKKTLVLLLLFSTSLLAQDNKSAEDLHQLFFKLRSDLGQTFVIVTHNQSLAAQSDRQLLMKDGIIIN